jgi:DNA-binding NarL/FixJ family response regulator
MRILIVDSNKLFAVGLQHFLEASRPGTKTAYASCHAEAAAKLHVEQFGLLLLDIGLTKDNGLRLLKRLRAAYPQLPLLVLSDVPVDYYGPKVIRAGACGFIGKDSEPMELLRAVECVLEGKQYVSVELADRLVRGLGVNGSDDVPHGVLSPREFQIFRRLALGQSPTQVARELNLSVKTVDTHRTNILHKMGLDSREQLARYAFEQGLIPSRRLADNPKASSPAPPPTMPG